MSNGSSGARADLQPSGAVVAVNPLVAVWRQRLLFILVFVSVILCAAIARLVLPVRYFASGSVIVAEPETGLSYPPAGWAQKVGDPADLESQLLVVRSPRILRLVMTAPGIVERVQAECRRSFRLPFMPGGSCDVLKADTPELLDYLQSRYSFGGAGRSRVINISYVSADPDTAQQMANTLITLFLEDHRKALSSGRALAAKGITQEMDRLDAEIRKADAVVMDYRRRKGLTNGATASFTSERLSSIGQQLSAAEASRDSAAAILATVKSGGSVASLPAVLESRSVADIKQQLTAAIDGVAAAASVLGPRHPRLRSLQGQVRTLQQSLDAEIGHVVASAQKQYDSANGIAASLRKQMETAKTAVSEATVDEGSVEQMVRDAAIKRQQYAELNEQRKTLESEERAVLGSTRLVSLAERPLKPFFPKTIPFLAGGTVLALLSATGSAVLRDRWNRGRVQAPADLQVPPDDIAVLARFPKIDSADGRDFVQALHAADAAPGLQSSLEVLYKAIRTTGKSRSLVMVSAFPEQGKTFAIVALARYAARAGNHVLVVEGNMRQPFLEAALDLRAVADLEDILQGQVHPQLAVNQTEVPRLDVIVARRGLEDSADLLAGQGLSDLLGWAKIYDLVLFDSPALDTYMDAGLLATRVDGLLLCARGPETDSGATSMVGRRLARLGAHVIGIVYTGETSVASAVSSAMLRSANA